MSPKPDLLTRTFALMREKRLTYAEARKELGRRGAAARNRKKRRVAAAKTLLERMGLA